MFVDVFLLYYDGEEFDDEVEYDGLEIRLYVFMVVIVEGVY